MKCEGRVIKAGEPLEEGVHCAIAQLLPAHFPKGACEHAFVNYRLDRIEKVKDRQKDNER